MSTIIVPIHIDATEQFQAEIAKISSLRITNETTLKVDLGLTQQQIVDSAEGVDVDQSSSDITLDFGDYDGPAIFLDGSHPEFSAFITTKQDTCYNVVYFD